MNEILAKAASGASLETVKQANNFLTKLFGPGLEESGLIRQDNTRFRRWKNEIDILHKAQQYLSAKGLSPKEIPLKSLVPLLEYSSLEEEESLKDMWAKLLTNMIKDSDRDKSVYVHILKEISSVDAYILQHVFVNTNKHQRDNYGEMNYLLFNPIMRADILKAFPRSNSNIENLIRLKLLDESPTIKNNSHFMSVVLSILGKEFYEECNS